MWIHSTVRLLTVPCDVLFHDSGRQRCVTILQLISTYLVLVALTTVSRRLSSGHLDAGPGGQSGGGGVWMASGGELQTQICRVSCAVRSHLGAVHLTECKMMHRRWMSWGEIAGATGAWSQMTNVQSGSSWWMENRYSNWWSRYHTQTQYRLEGVSTSETLIQRWNNICRQSCFELMLCLINHYKAEIFVYKSWSQEGFFNLKSP